MTRTATSSSANGRTGSFKSRAHEAQLAVIQAGLALMDDFERALKPHGITSTQFNVLRILRGAKSEGLCRNEIRDRMVNRMPDVTRLLDRMEEAGWIERERSLEDRRMVYTRITGSGLRLLDAVDDDVVQAQERPFADIPADDLDRLVSILKKIRRSS